MSATVEEVLIQMRNELRSLGDEQDVPNTRRAQETDFRQRQYFTARISALQQCQSRLSEVVPKVEAASRWVALLPSWRKTLEGKLAELPSSGRSRAQTDQATLLDLSMRCIDRGFDAGMDFYPTPLFDLIAAAGFSAPTNSATPGNYWLAGCGSLPEAEQRLAELQLQREQAQDRIDRILSEEALRTAHRIGEEIPA